jgi:enoyl-[acyl-carrier protein] reductase I
MRLAMGLVDGKKAVVFGVANEWSLATHIGAALRREGAALGIAHLPGDKMERRVRRASEHLQPAFYAACDVQRDEDIDAVFERTRETFGSIDILVHSLAFAPADALERPFLETTREAFRIALDVSTYSLIALARAASPLMAPNGSILTLTFMASGRYFPNYNVMALAKAALECSVRYLAVELGRSRGVRVNAISAGAVKTLSAKGIAGVDRIFAQYPEKAPLGRAVTADDVGNAALYLCSDLASAVTGEVHYVDAGFNVVG